MGMDSTDALTESAVVKSAITARGWFDYRHMFDLDGPAMTTGPVLDCPAGASSFGAGLSRATGPDPGPGHGQPQSC